MELKRLRRTKWTPNLVGGCVHLDDGKTTIDIDLSLFSDEDRRQLIEQIRQHQDESTQIGWAEFATADVAANKTKDETTSS